MQNKEINVLVRPKNGGKVNSMKHSRFSQSLRRQDVIVTLESPTSVDECEKSLMSGKSPKVERLHSTVREAVPFYNVQNNGTEYIMVK